jgi:CRP/FNR family transcriptional regulator, cyclic AMP receptor protein
MESNKILEIINRLPFFDKFSPIDKEKIISKNAQFAIFKDGEKIITEGENDTNLYILLSGTAQVSKNESETVLATVEAGQIFGEMSFLTHSTRTTNVISNKNAITLKIDHKLMENLDNSIREKIKDKIIEKLTTTIVDMNNKIISHSF